MSFFTASSRVIFLVAADYVEKGVGGDGQTYLRSCVGGCGDRIIPRSIQDRGVKASKKQRKSSTLLVSTTLITMPIIPRYSITQTSTHVHVEVSIPHVRVSPTTLDLVIVDGTELHLYAPPTYLLKLALPDRVVDENAVEESLACSVPVSVVNVQENDDEKCTGSSASRHFWTSEDLPKMRYNPEKNHGTLVLILRKEEEGFWKDLDLLGRLQQPTKARQRSVDQTFHEKRLANPIVTMIGEQEDADEDGNDIGENENNTSEVLTDLLSINQTMPKYGLFQNFSNVFRDYAREGLAHEMLECPNPDEVYSTSAHDGECESNVHFDEQNRRKMRLEMENNKFDSDRYLNDLNIEEEGDMIFDSAMMMVPHWMEPDEVASHNSIESVENITERIAALSTSANSITGFFTAEESHLLASIPPQHHNIPIYLTDEQKRSAFLTLTDILFAYAYDHRTTDGDPTVESSWTVMILSSSLSWLEHYNPPYDTVVDALRWNIRRSLIYPYLRIYSLSRHVVNDVCRIIMGGRRRILRCLLQLHRTMERSECHYLFNKLYIDPLIGWIQRCEESEVLDFGKEILLSTSDDNDFDLFGKDSLGLDLLEREKIFLACQCDENDTSSGEDDFDDSDDDNTQIS